MARVLLWLAERRTMVRPRNKALRVEFAQRAVRELRRRHDSRLAAGLLVLGRASLLARSYPEAVEAAQEARTLAADDPLRVAQANRIVAEALRLRGRPAEGLEPGEAAVAGLREIDGQEAMAGLANALFTCGEVYIAIGRPADAVRSLREALEVHRALKTWRRHTVPDFIRAEADLAWALNQTREYEEALRVADRSADLTGTLTRLQPRVFRPIHAAALSAAAVAHHHLGHPESAIEAARRGVAAYRLVPTARTGLAGVLGTLADLLRLQGNDAEADRLDDEIISIYRALAENDPANGARRLYAALKARRDRERQAGDHRTALATEEEMLGATRLLVGDAPEHRPRLIKALGTLIRRLEPLDADETRRLADEAVSLARRPDTPGQASLLGRTLRWRAWLLREHDAEASRRDLDESIPLLRAAADDGDEDARADLASAERLRAALDDQPES
jgi:tetratricopeptide (TPR) repeat protein